MKSKVIVVTGAGSGIGLATCNYLSQKGHKVYGLSRRGNSDGSFTPISCDVTNYQAVQQALQSIVDAEGKLDVFVNNAGMGVSGAAELIPPEQTESMFKVNTMAAMECARLAIPYLKQSRGSLVFVSSVAAVVPIPYQAGYSASKAAINLFAEALRLEVNNFGVKVSVVMPGDTKTGFTAARSKVANEGDYDGKVQKSVGKMERDEQKGRSPLSVAKVIAKLIANRNPPPTVAVGWDYKLVCWLVRILPQRFVVWLVGKIYG